MATIASLSVMLSANASGFVTGLTVAEKKAAGFKDRVESQLSSAGASVQGMLGTVAALASGFGAVAAVRWGLSVASEAEQAQVTLETLLQSGDKAAKMFTALQRLASKTAFSQQDVMQGATQLLTGGFAESDIMSMMTLLSDAASANPAGMAEGMKLMARALADIRTKGKLAGEEVRQLHNAMIPITDILAKKLGKTGVEVSKLIEAGAVDSGTAITAILEYSQQRFDGLAAKQSRTLGGVWSSLKDDAGNALGAVTAELAKSFGVTDGMASLSEWLQTLQADAANVAVSIRATIKPVQESAGAVFDVLREMVSQIQEMTPAFDTGVSSTRSWRNAAIDAFEAVLGTAALTVDYVSFMFSTIDIGWRKAVRYFKAGAKEIQAHLEETLANNAPTKALENYYRLAAATSRQAALEWRQFGDELNDERDHLLEQLRTGKSASVRQVTDWFAGFRSKDAAAELQRMLDDVNRFAENLIPQGGITIKVKELQLAKGAVDPLAKQLELELQKKRETQKTDAESITDRVNPLHRLQKQMDKLNQMVVDGDLGIQDYRRSVAELGDELIKMADLQDPKSAAAITAGSTEAYSRAVQQTLPQMSPEEKLLAAQQKMLEKLEKGNKLGEKFLETLRQLKPLPVVSG